MKERQKTPEYREWRRKHYQKHKEAILGHTKKWRDKWLKPHQQKIQQIKDERGNKCELCGFNEEPRILQFHHLRDKEFELGRGYNRTITELKKEAIKCVLVCPNCHFRIHQFGLSDNA